MNNDFDKNAIIFKKMLTLNCSMGNENVLVIFIAGVITLHKYHFRYITMLKKKIAEIFH